MRRYDGGWHSVDFEELGLLRLRRARHAGQLLVEAEEVLVGDGGSGNILAFDLHLLFGFDGLMQPLRVTAAVHQPARELVHDDDLPVPYDVVHVSLVARMGAQRGIDVLENL